MALIKDSLWGIVKWIVAAPETEREAPGNNRARRDKALAIVVLAMGPSLLYLLDDPEDPRAMRTKLEEQFQCKTWANKLHLRHKFFLHEAKRRRICEQAMTEIFEALTVIGDAVTEGCSPASQSP